MRGVAKPTRPIQGPGGEKKRLSLRRWGGEAGLSAQASAGCGVRGGYLYILYLMGHVVEPQVVGQRRSIQAVPVGQQEVGAPERFPTAAGRAALQRREVRDEAGPAVRGEAGGLLALAVGPSALLLAGGRRRRLVQRVDGERVPEVRVGVAGLGVRQRLVRGGEVRRLEVGGSGVGERRGRAVQVLADRREVREPRVAVAAPIVAVLEITRKGEGEGRRRSGAAGPLAAGAGRSRHDNREQFGRERGVRRGGGKSRPSLFSGIS